MLHTSRTLRQYLLEMGAALAVYTIGLVLSLGLIQANPHAWWRLPVALLPMIPAVFVLWAFVKSFRERDELQRKQNLEAFAFAFGATMLITFGYGFLENVGFPHLA